MGIEEGERPDLLGAAPSRPGEAFGRRLDSGEDRLKAWESETPRRPGPEPRRVNVDLPSWVVDALDVEAKRIGVSRQAVIKIWIAERLERLTGS
ncbi:MAG: CopG family transcriptional regulator [Gemmatimonadetes bacterium]|nr:CopG family transcriptional regulator [Gemmatimonadota bacterium]